MTIPVLATLFAFGLAAGSSLAQQTRDQAPQQPPQPPPPQQQAPAQQPPPPPAPRQQTADVSDAEIEKFAEIYVEVQETRDTLSRQLSETDSQQEAQQIQERMRDAIVDTIETHGWSVERYNRVATAISNDPEKRDAALQIINDQSG